MKHARIVGVISLGYAAALAGCGDDGGATTDGGPTGDGGIDAPISGACSEDREPSAWFSVVSEPTASHRFGGQAFGQLQAGPSPRMSATLLAEGGCRYVGPSPTSCDPACTGGTICDIDGTCAAYPDTLAAGTFSITGTTPPVSLTPMPGNSYYLLGSHPGFFHAGDEVTLALSGDGPVAPLAATVRGVPPLALPTTQLTAREHQAMVVRWTAVANPAGAEVLLHFDSDHHGIRAYLECTAPASAGTLTIPAAVLDRLILAGETGIGTFIENAWIELHHQARLDTPRGCAVLETYADEFVSVDTIRAP